MNSCPYQVGSDEAVDAEKLARKKELPTDAGMWNILSVQAVFVVVNFSNCKALNFSFLAANFIYSGFFAS